MYSNQTMTQLRFLSALTAAGAALVLCACSSTNGYYQNDGPPLSGTLLNEGSVTPKVETFASGSLRPYTVMGKRYVPVTTDSPMDQTGIGSWYGKQFHGNKTAIGEIYNMHAMTAAHPTMPLPSYARVTNLENGRSVIVRVNDRGPFLYNRIIDLSYAAASSLGSAEKGTAKVRVTRLTNAEIASGAWRSGTQTHTQPVVTPVAPVVVTPGADKTFSAPANSWGVQIGFFTEEANARSYAAHAEAVMSSSGSDPVRIVRDNGGYRVIVGTGRTITGARAFAETVRSRLGTAAFPIQR